MEKKEILINDEELFKVKGGTNSGSIIKFIPNRDFDNAIFGEDNNGYENFSSYTKSFLEKDGKNVMDSSVACKKPKKRLKK